jgi:tetratricopeptide (TPR) repeat protein
MNRNTFFRFLAVLMVFCAALNSYSQNSINNKLTSEEWSKDIDYYIEQMPKVHINPYHTSSKESFMQFAEVLKGKIHHMSDNEIITQIAKMTAMIGDGHTALNIFGFHDKSSGQVKNLHIFPLKFYIFSDGLFVTGSAPQYKELEGAKITKVNGMDIQEVINKIKPIVPCDNEYSSKFNIPYYMVIPEFLNGLGVIPDINEMELTYLTPEGNEKSIKIASTEIGNMQHSSGSSTDKGLPLYMRNDEKNYWFDYLSDSKTLYINYKRVLIDPADSLKNFCKRIEEFANSNDIERTVIDIRNNGGGNNGTCQPFVNLISNNTKINRKGKLFIILGRQTFSAASYLTTKLEYNTKAIFIGEPSGASPNHYGDNRPLVLPNSKLEVRLSSIYWQNSFPFDNRISTEPAINIEMSSHDYFSGKDPVMEAILNYKPDEIQNTAYDKKIAGTYLYSPLQSLIIKDNGSSLNMKVMQVDFLGRNVSYINTTLYPKTEKSFTTDINGLTVEMTDNGINLNYRANEMRLSRVDGEFKTPIELLAEGKNSEAVEMIKQAREKNPSYTGVNENAINVIGYAALGNKNYEGAIAIFALNCEYYPDSFNTYDSLGEALMMAGSYKDAIENYKKSVELNPKNENGKKMIEKLSK